MMDLLKLSTNWAKAEVFSAKIVFLCSILVLLAAAGFYFFGKTGMAKAFIWPMFTSGILLITVSFGLYFSNKPRIAHFELAAQNNAKEFVKQEIKRTTKSENDFNTVFKVLPTLLMVGGLIILFLPAPIWRAIGITLAFLVAFLMLVDSNTAARNSIYHEQLKNFNDVY